MLRRSFVIVLAFLVLGTALCQEKDTHEEEAAHLATLLKWKPGIVVAEIGAGDGRMTLAAAQHVGATGRVYATEIDEKALAHLREIAAKERNITPVKATQADCNLPPESCDSIFMRLSYHHLTKPVETDASFFRSLKPGGLLAVIDEDPVPGAPIPEGVPKNRIWHGIPQKTPGQGTHSGGLQGDD
jgi:ubiquinone/menaquinone biosynthesis C-methylase UbiE